VRVEAVDLVDDGHGREGGVVLWRAKPRADGTASPTATTRHRNPAHS